MRVMQEVDVLIVGGGPAADRVIRGIIHQDSAHAAGARCRVAIVEPGLEIGLGTAWDTPHPFMRANMHADDLKLIGALKPDGGLETQTPAPFMLGDAAFPDRYATRGEVGDALRGIVAETRGLAESRGISIRHLRASAYAVARQGLDFVLTLEDGTQIRAPCVVLALGLLPIDRYPHLAQVPGYHLESWNSGDLVGTLAPETRVAILGAGPTGIDWALQLLDSGIRAPIQILSRSGLLPAVRPVRNRKPRPSNFDKAYLRRLHERGPFSPQTVNAIIIGILAEAGAAPADLAACDALYRTGGWQLLERTLRLCERPSPVFEGLKQIDELAPTIWALSGQEARDYIMAKWARRHAAFSFAIPPDNAQVILSAHQEGRLVTRRGLKFVEFRDGAFRLKVTSRAGQLVEYQADVVINATGFDGAVSQTCNAFVRRLLAGGLLRPSRHGGVMMEFETGAVLDGEGYRVPGLFIAGGSLTRGAGYTVNSLARTSAHAFAVGREAYRRLQLRRAHASGRIRLVEST